MQTIEETIAKIKHYQSLIDDELKNLQTVQVIQPKGETVPNKFYTPFDYQQWRRILVDEEPNTLNTEQLSILLLYRLAHITLYPSRAKDWFTPHDHMAHTVLERLNMFRVSKRRNRTTVCITSHYLLSMLLLHQDAFEANKRAPSLMSLLSHSPLGEHTRAYQTMRTTSAELVGLFPELMEIRKINVEGEKCTMKLQEFMCSVETLEKGLEKVAPRVARATRQ